MPDNDDRPRDAPAGRDYADLPGVPVTVNQLVAYNMAYFRKAAGLTQEELGDLLGGWTARPWSKAAVSAAERSWDGRRLRQFDADLLLGLALALGVPIAALFLPPEDDGVKCRYLIDQPHPAAGGQASAGVTMRDLLGFVLSDPSDDDSPAAVRYRQRFVATIARHYPGLLPSDYFDDLTTEEQIKARATRLRAQHDALRGLLGDLEHTFEALDDRLAQIRDDRLVPADDET